MGTKASTAYETSEIHRGLSPRTARVLIMTLCVIQFVDVLGTTIVIVALPAIQLDLNLSNGAREQVAGIYALMFRALLLLAGRLVDAWGARRLFIAGLITFGLGSVGGGLAPDGVSLIVGRGVQGIGAALAVPAALAMVAGLFPAGSDRNRVVGYWAATGAMGGGAGFAFGGLITEAVSWRWTLLLNVPVVVAAASVMLVLHVPEAARGRATVPLIPSLTLTAGLLALTLGLTNGQTHGLAIITVILPIAAGLSLLGVFARGECGARPLIPASAWQDRALLSGAGVALTLTFTTTASAVLLTLYLQQIRGVSAAEAGWVLVPFSVAVVVGAPIGARLMSSRRGAISLMQWALIGVAASQGVHIVALGLGSLGGIIIGMTVSGFTLGIASVASTAHGLSASGATEQGAASGLLNAAARVGTAVGIAVFGIVAAITRSAVSGSENTATITGYQAAHMVGIVLIIATIILIRDQSLSTVGRWGHSLQTD